MKKLNVFISLLLCLLIFGCGSTDEVNKVEEINIKVNEMVLNVGESYNIDYEIFPNDVEVDVIWKVGNNNICSINDGVVTGLSFGSTVVTVMSRNDTSVYDTVNVVVERRVFDITYELNGGKFDGNYVDSYEEGIGVVLPTPIKDGFTFIGWDLDGSIITSIDSNVNKDVVLSAVWEEIYIPAEYAITYDLGDGGYFEGQVVDTFTEGVGLNELPTPLMEGYNFIGWTLDGKTITSIDGSINKNVVLVARWEKIVNKYSIEYELDGGHFDGEVVNSFIENIGLDVLPTPIKDGYDFIGWYLDNELISSINKDYNKNVVLVAKWQKSDNYDEVMNANVVIDLINALPYNTTYNDKIKIDYAKSYYDDLSDEAKELVTNIDVLNNKLSEISNIENNINEITYVLGDNIALSKDDLFVNFFSDFYNYIKNYHGLEQLETKGINSLEDFLELASNYDAGRGQMREIGDIACTYLLVKDVNGIIANQPESTFIGYCYKNNLYVDLIPFFIRFFAYWRIDEKYANINNYGADFFAEGWAPTVDIAKFFYYDSETTYVKSERMLDCFNFTANVVYGDLPVEVKKGLVLPTDIRLRGYTFDGWYDNPEFNGNKIESITDTSKKIILYAKWIEDTDVADKDKAELVDIYTYNLTTTPANVTKKTVQYVVNMYDELSVNARQYVYRYSTLLEYSEKFADYFDEPIEVTINANFDIPVDIAFVREQFLLDFNGYTNSNLANLDKLITKRYSYMDEMREFYQDSVMRAKWGYLIDLVYAENCFTGLQIQVERIKNNQSGDLEYFISGLCNLLMSKDASSDTEILVDYSKKEIMDEVVSKFGKFNLTFEFASYIPSVIIYGYDLIGYYDSQNNQVYKITENGEHNLVAIYKKN